MIATKLDGRVISDTVPLRVSQMFAFKIRDFKIIGFVPVYGKC
jgi:hypothetical protein